jgi:hypothetical protein
MRQQMIWYVPTLPFNQQRTLSLHTAISLHPAHFPQTRDCNYAYIIPSRLHVCEDVLFQKVHGYRVCSYIPTSWFPAHQSTFPARPVPCHAVTLAAPKGCRLRRDKGLGKACCEAPVGQTTDVDATGADAATSLNALADCSLVGFSFLTTHTHTHSLTHTQAHLVE